MNVLIVVFALISILFASCKTIQQSTVYAPKIDDKIITSPELHSLLIAQPKLSVVLRVPNSSNRLTEEDRGNNYIYDVIQDALLSSGFNVKDRASVEKILSNTDNLSDYKQMGEKAGVDLFIEINSLELNIDNYQQGYATKSTKSTMPTLRTVIIPVSTTSSTDLDMYAFNTRFARMKITLIIAKTGDIAGIFTLHKQTCLNGAPIEMDQSKGNLMYRKFGDSGWAYQLLWSLTKEETADYFANELIKILKNK